MRKNKGLRRIAALANAVGLTHLAQGGAQLVVKLGVIGASTSSRPCTTENASSVLYTCVTHSLILARRSFKHYFAC